jgi:heme oxygenase
MAGLARHEIYRAEAIACDLAYVHGAPFESELPLLPAGAAYAQRIEQVAGSEPYRLVAHAYTRYLGDLSGGQLLARLLRRTLALERAGLSFLDFPGIARPAAFKAQYRRVIDAASTDACTRQAIMNEARAAFEHNIRLSDAVAAACGAPHARQAATPAQ